MVDSGIRTRYFRDSHPRCHPTYILCKPPWILQTRSLRVTRNFSETKNAHYWFENFAFLFTLKVPLTSKRQKVSIESPENEEFDSRMKTKHFSIEPSSTSVKLSIETFIEEIKLVLMQKNKFEYWGKLKLLALFGFLGQPRIWFKDQNEQFFKRIFHYKWEAFDWDRHWRNLTGSYVEIWVWTSRSVNINWIFQKSD